MEENKTLEDKLNDLSELLKKMESPEATLTESFELYKQGVTTIKECTEMIDKVEKELIILEEGNE